jgi:large subunit ribosomal protein L47
MMIWVLTKVQIRKTQKAIKVCLTERWYSWEEARVAAMEDEEINLYADTEKGQPAYLPKQFDDVRLQI